MTYEEALGRAERWADLATRSNDSWTVGDNQRQRTMEANISVAYSTLALALKP